MNLFLSVLNLKKLKSFLQKMYLMLICIMFLNMIDTSAQNTNVALGKATKQSSTSFSGNSARVVMRMQYQVIF